MKGRIPSGNNVYVVIMTFGHRTDNMAFRAIVDNEYKYLGVLGSKTKVEQMRREWVEAGVSEEKIKGVYSPIGIQIKSQTPPEIAISIAAEIISVKNAD
jgi:xanthine dehydrogenase accessory factor